jgi:hypothetical protein
LEVSGGYRQRGHEEEDGKLFVEELSEKWAHDSSLPYRPISDRGSFHIKVSVEIEGDGPVARGARIALRLSSGDVLSCEAMTTPIFLIGSTPNR